MLILIKSLSREPTSISYDYRLNDLVELRYTKPWAHELLSQAFTRFSIFQWIYYL